MPNDSMTENDLRLIKKAFETSYTDWSLVEKMKDQADSEQAKKILHDRATSLYHREEFYAGLL